MKGIKLVDMEKRLRNSKRLAEALRKKRYKKIEFLTKGKENKILSIKDIEYRYNTIKKIIREMEK